ncbi:hypothetical protein [Massilibacteroides sp.]|uniref:hypothetical protein n=1 Tax=Massilibacteroides sp. TaxID=2034766 RepID=UPI00261CFBC6|nr:hypothetical protein [Massilibacteroides sp.]MDD4514129.1 hypothetical protein [Massilibacteroides sp.]
MRKIFFIYFVLLNSCLIFALEENESKRNNHEILKESSNSKVSSVNQSQITLAVTATNIDGGQLVLRGSNGVYAISSNASGPVAYYTINAGTYTVYDIKTSTCEGTIYVSCNGTQINNGSVVTFTTGGHIGFYCN